MPFVILNQKEQVLQDRDTWSSDWSNDLDHALTYKSEKAATVAIKTLYSGGYKRPMPGRDQCSVREVALVLL